MIYYFKSKYLSWIVLTAFFIQCDGPGYPPGIVVYKTKADYFYNLHVSQKNDGSLRSYPSHWGIINTMQLEEITDTFSVGRKRLDDNYVLAADNFYCDADAFLSITQGEYIRFEMLNYGDSYDIDSLISWIIDDDPYLEYYYDNNKPPLFDKDDVSKINEIIKNGELERFFKREK